MVLTAYFVLSPVTGLFCHRHRRNCFRQLDASVGASGPHDFAVRNNAARLASPSRPSHPASTFVTIAKRPSCESGTRGRLPLIWGCDQYSPAAAHWHDGQITHDTHARTARRRANHDGRVYKELD